MNVLVTGAAGYIGSHAVKHLLRAGHRVVGLDNFARGPRGVIQVLGSLPGATDGGFVFEEGDIADVGRVRELIVERGVDAVMHFAAYAYVRESVDHPLMYWVNNTARGLLLLDACVEAGVSRFVLSSTCATYGEPSEEHLPITESCPQQPINPYGRSKLALERALIDQAQAMQAGGRPFSVALLRYFNVAGCDTDGVLGEDHDPETHVIPILLQVALGQRERFTVFGTDYPTPDGTCVRDFIHVDDLVDAHVRALEASRGNEVRAYNLGIGRGTSVREIVDAAQRVTGAAIPVVEGARAAGDPPVLHASAAKAQEELGWSPRVTEVEAIVESAWAWMRRRPRGYDNHRGDRATKR
jgi:UDP-glucose 4-epimerase